MKILGKIFKSREFILLVVVCIVIAIVGTRSEYFFTLYNIQGLLLNISVYTIIGIGMTILFVSGGFDMSVGTHMAFLGIIAGVLMGNGVPVYLAITLTMILGLVNGVILGLIVTRLKVNPFVATLGAYFIFRGLAFLIGITSKVRTAPTTASIKDFPESFRSIGGGVFYGVEYINIYMFCLLVIFIILLARNVFFRQNYYVGGDVNAARLAGIKVNIITIFNFALVSLMVAIASILRISRVGTATATSGGQDTALLIIAAVIIGGASLRGGTGSIFGTFLGVVLIATINNGITILGINPFYSQIVIGSILLFSVLMDEFLIRSRSMRLKSRSV
jgi:ribose transport system permease protein